MSENEHLAPENTNSNDVQPADSALVRSPFTNEKGEPASSAMKAALDEFWFGLKRLPAYLKLAAAMGRDPRVPKSAKAVLVTGGAYAVSPIDLVPGIIPVAGQLDDLYVILTAIQQAVRLTPDAVAAEHLAKTGITPENITHDLASVRRLVKEAAVATAKYGLRTMKQTGNRIRRFADQNLQRGGAKHANKPL
jgi:uncharacterized membrane protein YkvA (DUF1232 family)